jgi:hypothetical protein
LSLSKATLTIEFIATQVIPRRASILFVSAPWDYWESAGAKPKGRTQEIIYALERVLERNPGHAGAIHFYIHTMEASTKPNRALPFARQLGQQMPGAGHIVHMPAHIYYRVGLYKDALDANIAAIGVDEKYFRNSPSDPFYKGAYNPHNVHFVLVPALMGGEGKTALDAGAKLDQVIDRDFLKMAGGLQPVKAAPYFSHVQFSTLATILALPDPGRISSWSMRCGITRAPLPLRARAPWPTARRRLIN